MTPKTVRKTLATSTEFSRIQPGIYTIPGKAFVLGEYAVLTGGTGLIACLPPRFSLGVHAAPEGGDAVASFHPQSPAGRLLARLREADDSITRHHLLFEDPLHGSGGFGGSTAEFALLLRAVGIDDAILAHRIYREVTDQGQEWKPSGADLLAQWSGGIVKATPGGVEDSIVDDVTDVVRSFHWLVFTAAHLHGRKVKTHEHLGVLDRRSFESLQAPLELGFRAIDDRDPHALGQALVAYADQLHEMGLEDQDAAADRAAVLELPGVLGAKGCGAMLSEGFVALCESRDAIPQVIDCLEGRGLKLFSDGLAHEAGVRVEQRGAGA